MTFLVLDRGRNNSGLDCSYSNLEKYQFELLAVNLNFWCLLQLFPAAYLNLNHQYSSSLSVYQVDRLDQSADWQLVPGAAGAPVSSWVMVTRCCWLIWIIRKADGAPGASWPRGKSGRSTCSHWGSDAPLWFAKDTKMLTFFYFFSHCASLFEQIKSWNWG